jgi:hypothetical protein
MLLDYFLTVFFFTMMGGHLSSYSNYFGFDFTVDDENKEEDDALTEIPTMLLPLTTTTTRTTTTTENEREKIVPDAVYRSLSFVDKNMVSVLLPLPPPPPPPWVCPPILNALSYGDNDDLFWWSTMMGCGPEEKNVTVNGVVVKLEKRTKIQQDDIIPTSNPSSSFEMKLERSSCFHLTKDDFIADNDEPSSQLGRVHGGDGDGDDDDDDDDMQDCSS